MKVMVFDPDMQEPIGIGELGYDDLHIVDEYDDTKMLFTIPNHPRIVMEDGEIIYGIECWWMPL